MSDSITVVGTVATDPRHVKTDEQLEVTTFRLASSQRHYDKKQQKWVDNGTNWYTVVAFRQLASNAAKSIGKGDRVIAHGRPRVRDWVKDDRRGTVMEVEVDALGHDLLWGHTQYQRTAGNRDAQADWTVPSAGAAATEAAGAAAVGSAATGGSGISAPDQAEAPSPDREPAAAF